MNCKNGCTGACRCGHAHEICLVVGEKNEVVIPCPDDKNGCILDGHDTDTLTLYCPCCGDIVQEFVDILELNLCSGCTLTVNLTAYPLLEKMRHSDCKLDYTFKLTSTVSGNDIVDKIYLRGQICLDWDGIRP